MTLINKEQLLSDIVNLPSPLDISSNGVDSTYMEVYLTGKAKRQFEIIDIINKQQTEKPKRKFRVMTNTEFCNKHKYCNACPEYKGDMNRCYGFMHGIANIEPYRNTNGKYILIEVKE